MFFIHGKRRIRIKRFADHDHPCTDCKSFDLDVKVYREYYHVFFIPIIPVGDNEATIRCKQCGEPIRTTTLVKAFEKKAGIPFLLYTGAALLISPFIVGIIANIYTQRQKKEFVSAPRINDVYLVKRDSLISGYYYLRVSNISGDTVTTNPNNLLYLDYVSEMGEQDFFSTKEAILFTKDKLKQMLDSGEINAVERDYDSSSRFTRVH